MSNSIAYLTSRVNFLQVSPDIPITKQRNPEKYDSEEVFEGKYLNLLRNLVNSRLANKKELVADLIVKAKQVDYLINSLPVPESEEAQVSLETTLTLPPMSSRLSASKLWKKK